VKGAWCKVQGAGIRQSTITLNPEPSTLNLKKGIFLVLVNLFKSVDVPISADFLFRILDETYRILIGKRMLGFENLTLNEQKMLVN